VIKANDVVYLLTREDVIACAKEMRIPKKAITDDVFYKVRKGAESAWEGWPEVVKAAISYALKD
jgi:stalled ribosome rescue protein Dom34